MIISFSQNKIGEPAVVGSATIANLTASKPVFSDASKKLVSTGTQPVDQGGTGQTTYAVGDLLYASTTGVLSKLADVAVGSVLVSGGVNATPAYSATPSVTSVTLSGINPDAAGNVALFASAATGETPEFTISGYRTADALRSLEIGVGVDGADTASFDGVSNYYFDGNIGIGTISANKLHVHGGAGAVTAKIQSSGDAATLDLDGVKTTSVVFSQIVMRNNVDSVVTLSGIRDGAADAGAYTVGTQPTGGTIIERMRITSTGTIGFGGNLSRKYTVTTDNTNGADTYTAAEMFGGLILRGTDNAITAAVIDVTATAAAIVAAIPGCIVGSGFEFRVSNRDATHTVSVDGGVGVTMSPNDPSTVIPVGSTGTFLVVVTNATAASEAATIHCLGIVGH